MATSYTDILRIAKQGTGDNPNTWGFIANEQVFERFEDAVAGLAQVDVTGGATDIVLTTSNGGEDQARKAILRLTGFPTANKNVVVPSVSKVYVIKADFTGTHTVTITTGFGSGVGVKTGERKHIFTDGIDVIDLTPLLGELAYKDTIDDPSLIDDGVLTTDKLADGAVTGGKIADGAITEDKLAVGAATPVGTIEQGLWATAPSGRLALRGQTVSRTTYATLFNHLTTAGLIKPQIGKQTWEFGSGDGSTTFTLADYSGLFLRGTPSDNSSLGVYQGDAIRNITGKWYTSGDRFTGNDSNHFEGAMYQERRHNTWQYSGQGLGNRLTGVGFDASRVVPTATENRPVNISLMTVIKY